MKRSPALWLMGTRVVRPSRSSTRLVSRLGELCRWTRIWVIEGRWSSRGILVRNEVVLVLHRNRLLTGYTHSQALRLLALLRVLDPSSDIVVISPHKVRLTLGRPASVGLDPTLIIDSFLRLLCKSLVGIVVGGCWAYHWVALEIIVLCRLLWVSPSLRTYWGGCAVIRWRQYSRERGDYRSDQKSVKRG